MKTTIITIINLVLCAIAVNGKTNANSITPGNIEKLIGKVTFYPDFAKQQKLKEWY